MEAYICQHLDRLCFAYRFSAQLYIIQRATDAKFLRRREGENKYKGNNVQAVRPILPRHLGMVEGMTLGRRNNYSTAAGVGGRQKIKYQPAERTTCTCMLGKQVIREREEE